MVKCPALPQPAGGGLDALLANHIAVAGAYHRCAATHAGLVDVVRTQTRQGVKMSEDERR